MVSRLLARNLMAVQPSRTSSACRSLALPVELEEVAVDFMGFKHLALTSLIGHQLDNGSWLDDPVATVTAIEALSEECGGPDPACRFSAEHHLIDPEDAPRGGCSHSPGV